MWSGHTSVSVGSLLLLLCGHHHGVGQDADGNDILATIPIPSPASIGGARASSDFFDRFNDPNDSDHFGIFSRAEQRLVAEWLDIGAQYYNNPFDAPAN